MTTTGERTPIGGKGAAPRSGYLHESYVASLAEWGQPHRLPHADSWVLVRQIPGSERLDAAGCYPLMACGDWPALADEWVEKNQWVTFTAVPDPLGAPNEDELRRIFRDCVRPFKTHYLVDLDQWTAAAKAQHRTRVRLSTAQVETEVAPARPELLESWIELYAGLVAQHEIRGMQRFSRRSFEILFTVPGMHIARATAGGENVAMSLWATHDRYGYYHLSAASARGYEVSAPYAMVDAAIRYFKRLGLSHLDLGGGAGVREQRDNGLAAFKSGWTTTDRTAWVCGRIFDRRAYADLVNERASEYFPAYRTGEFG